MENSNRAIKFRAWISEIQEMVNVWKVDFDLNLIIWVGSHENVEGNYYKGNQKDCELMQYTGLKDKNGKGVFTGDIIRYYHHPDNVAVIRFDEELLTNKITIVSDGVYCEDYFFIKSDSQKIEVIGNIYENPELLNSSEIPNS